MSFSKNNEISSLLIEELKKPLPGFEAQRLMLPVTRQDRIIEVPNNAKKGAVLILLYKKNKTLTISFMKRTIDGSVHSGQISLPGGKMEKTDKDLTYTAIRETEEELGASMSKIKVLGILTPLYIPVSNYEVQPVVACIDYEPVFSINQHEVEELLEVSVNQLIHPDTSTFDSITSNNVEFNVPVYKIGEHKIWGATAMIISEFIQVYNRIKTV